jgi:hypothetical protein
VGRHHTIGAPRLDFLDKFSQATGNAQAPDRKSVRHACLWKATIMLFSRHKVAHEEKCKIMWNVASVAELKKIVSWRDRQALIGNLKLWRVTGRMPQGTNPLQDVRFQTVIRRC